MLFRSLGVEKFDKMMTFLHSPVANRVRTNNHVERTNRMIRFFEKVRYKWRRRRTLVRFVVLKLNEIWSSWSRPEAKAKTTADATTLKRRNRRRDDGIQPRRVA